VNLLKKLYQEILNENLGDKIFVQAGDTRNVEIGDKPRQPGGKKGDPKPPDEDEFININDDPIPPSEDDEDEIDPPTDDSEDGDGDDNNDNSDSDGKDEEESKGKWTEGKQVLKTHDQHDIIEDAMKKMGMSESDQKEVKERRKEDAEKTADIIRNRANELKKRIQGSRQGGDAEGGPGSKGGSESAFDAYVEKLYEPSIDWSAFDSSLAQFMTKSEREIKRFKIIQARALKEYQTKNFKISKNEPEHTYSRSLYNPLSRDMSGDDDERALFRGNQYKDINIKIIFLVTLDTSGSVGQAFYDIAASEAKGLLNHINSKFGKTKDKNAIYFMSWSGSDEQINVRHFNNMNASDFKIANFQSGTDPESIFRYINSHIIKTKSGILKMNLMKDPREDLNDFDDHILASNKEGEPIVLPFILTITDGGFSQMSISSIKPYTPDLSKNIWWLILNGSSEACYPKNIVQFTDKKY